MGLESKKFNAGDLQPCDWQYTIRHEHYSGFQIDDVVFHKSNPTVPFIVEHLDDETGKIGVRRENDDGTEEFYLFIPEVILQYHYASLQTFRRMFEVCFN